MTQWLKAWWFLLISGILLCGSGIIPAIIPQAVPAANKQGSTGAKFFICTGGFTAGHPVSTDANGNCIDGGASSGIDGLTTDVTATGPGTVAATLAAKFKVRSFGGSFDGGGTALTAGKTTYVTVPFACTISAWNILVDTGTATVDIWRVATGTAIPTVADTITAAAVPAISAGTAIHSTTLTGWCGTGTCLIAANDIIGVNLKVVASATFVNMVVECDQ